ncbi:MAG: macro domain-containing protein [Candidatus Lokiarchaeota archaeon]|jgi:O-acetyl-ADP-ribose deacetylase (regulator of RNase III)|nr:macro domain-containing protein [Candidatus Lokiarchaeota archaeon]
MKEIKVNNSVIKLVQGDITELNTDVIVNAANAQLILGGGVAGAIRRKGGPTIQEECDKIGGTIVGGAVITSGGNLKAKFVIHAVGPRMGEVDEDTKLKNAVVNSLKLMDERGLKTIAFPAISTGIFGYPIDRCAKIMISTAKKYLTEETQIKEIIFCLYSTPDTKVFSDELNE